MPSSRPPSQCTTLGTAFTGIANSLSYSPPTTPLSSGTADACSSRAIEINILRDSGWSADMFVASLWRLLGDLGVAVRFLFTCSPIEHSYSLTQSDLFSLQPHKFLLIMFDLRHSELVYNSLIGQPAVGVAGQIGLSSFGSMFANDGRWLPSSLITASYRDFAPLAASSITVDGRLYLDGETYLEICPTTERRGSVLSLHSDYCGRPTATGGSPFSRTDSVRPLQNEPRMIQDVSGQLLVQNLQIDGALSDYSHPVAIYVTRAGPEVFSLDRDDLNSYPDSLVQLADGVQHWQRKASSVYQAKELHMPSSASIEEKSNISSRYYLGRDHRSLSDRRTMSGDEFSLLGSASSERSPLSRVPSRSAASSPSLTVGNERLSTRLDKFDTAAINLLSQPFSWGSLFTEKEERIKDGFHAETRTWTPPIQSSISARARAGSLDFDCKSLPDDAIMASTSDSFSSLALSRSRMTTQNGTSGMPKKTREVPERRSSCVKIDLKEFHEPLAFAAQQAVSVSSVSSVNSIPKENEFNLLDL
ncbi:hypothetical protein HK405_010798, partial [Cladochytrium tenue]